ncbi:MAG: VCBS repeat-containing protein [PVC group bacterium]
MKQILTATAILFFVAAGAAPPADFDGDSRDDIAIFRPTAGLWAIRGVTRVYFGGSSDTPAAGDYTGDGIAEIGVFRKSAGLWAIRGVSRIYFGGSSDTAVAGGGGQRLYDYVVKPNDGADLVAALESTSHNSVFIPAGTYTVSEVINVPDNIKHIVGESNSTIIQFAGDGDYLSVAGPNCHLEELRFQGGGDTSPARGTVYIDDTYATVENCRSVDSLSYGFQYSSNATYVSFVNCVVRNAGGFGFYGSGLVPTSRLTNCSAYNCGTAGFVSCRNLSSCVVDGAGATSVGFSSCITVAACQSNNNILSGFATSYYLSACMVDGEGTTDYGFNTCHNLSSCHVEDLSGAGGPYNGSTLRDLESCD